MSFFPLANWGDLFSPALMVNYESDESVYESEEDDFLRPGKRILSNTLLDPKEQDIVVVWDATRQVENTPAIFKPFICAQDLLQSTFSSTSEEFVMPLLEPVAELPGAMDTALIRLQIWKETTKHLRPLVSVLDSWTKV
jgi:hypothetical protein